MVFDLEFNTMTLILILDLDMVVTYLHVTNEVCRPKIQKLWPGNADKQTDRQTCVKLLPTRSLGR